MDSIVRRVYHMKESHIISGKSRPRKTIQETIRNYIEINELKDMIFDKTL